MTTSSLVHELNDKTDYRLLTRINGSYKILGLMVMMFMSRMKWNQHVYLTHTHDPSKNLGSSECLFQLSYIKNSDTGQEMGVVKFDENSSDNFTAKLIDASFKANSTKRGSGRDPAYSFCSTISRAST